MVEAKKGNEKEKKNKNSKPDTHSFGLKQDETTGPFPEAVLLKEKKVKEDGRVLPEFADAEEEELFEFLNLQLESDLNLEEMRHYEVVYLIHQDHKDEVEAVNSKIQDFLREKQGRVWRFSDWGMRRLAYKIKKATHAHYILMNLELPAQWTDEFKSMLDKDERVIRHLVIKRDKAITEECPPPPEVQADMVDEYEVDDMDYDGGDDDYEVDDVDYGDGGDEELDDDNERDLEGYEDDDDVESEQFSSRNVVKEGGNRKKNVNDKSKKNQKREKVLR